MTTSGLVVTLDNDADAAADAVRAVLLAGPFTIGEVFGHRIAVALEADTPAEAERWHRWLTDLSGVLKVDTAYVHLDSAVEETAHV
jgi:hypothetical protein